MLLKILLKVCNSFMSAQPTRPFRSGILLPRSSFHGISSPPGNRHKQTKYWERKIFGSREKITCKLRLVLFFKTGLRRRAKALDCLKQREKLIVHVRGTLHNQSKKEIRMIFLSKVKKWNYDVTATLKKRKEKDITIRGS